MKTPKEIEEEILKEVLNHPIRYDLDEGSSLIGHTKKEDSYIEFKDFKKGIKKATSLTFQKSQEMMREEELEFLKVLLSNLKSEKMNYLKDKRLNAFEIFQVEERIAQIEKELAGVKE